MNTQSNTLLHEPEDYLDYQDGGDDFSPPRADGAAGLSQLNLSENVLNTAVHRLFEDATRRKELKERV